MDAEIKDLSAENLELSEVSSFIPEVDQIVAFYMRASPMAGISAISTVVVLS